MQLNIKAGLALTALAALGLAAALPQGAHAQTPAVGVTPINSPRTDFAGTLGFQFTTGNLPVVVTDLGFYAPNTLQDSHNVGIIVAGTHTFLVGSAGPLATVAANSTGAATGNFAYTPDVITLLPNTTYDILSNSPEDPNGPKTDGVNNNIRDPFIGDNATVVSNAPADVTYDFGLYSSDYGTNPGVTVSTNVNPANSSSYFGPNLEIAVAPEPSQCAGLALGAFGLAGLAFKARKRRA